MPRSAKIFIGIVGMVLIITLVVIIQGIRLNRESLAQTNGTIVVQGLNSSVQVYRDSYGVPHLFAKTEDDLFFAMGFVVSQDRLWQMDINRRAATGTLSEIFGAPTLAYDKLIRTIGLPEIANQLIENLSPESKRIITAYTAGVNAFLDIHKKHLPTEFIVMKYEPQPWDISHSLAFQRLIAWGLEMAWRVDPVFGELNGRVGNQKMSELLPVYPNNAPTIVDQLFLDWRKVQKTFACFNDDSFSLPGFFSAGTGSNSWVVSGKRSVTGKPILANDPHLAFQAPSLWYQVHLNAPGIDCYGVCLPGVPGIVIGHNQAIAWGLTNVMADGCDFFIESFNLNNPDQYLYQGKWQQLQKREEIITVKDQAPDTLIVRSTDHGPIISDLHPALRDTSKAITMKWSGRIISDEMLANYKIIKAKNWDQFLDGLQYFSVPPQNYVYADTMGNIGYYCTGLIPVRNSGNGLIPQPGWNDRSEWRSRIPFNALPHLFNPPENHIITANNKITDDRYPYFISTYWEPSYRAERIKQLLLKKERLAISDFKTIQMDKFSKHAEFLLPNILENLSQFDDSTKLKKYFTHSLKTWDLNLNQQSAGAAIFEIFLTKLFKNIFQDEMGDTLFQNFIALPNIPIRIADQLIRRGSSDWFDNIATPDTVETKDQILLLSLEQTYHYLESSFADSVYNWQWGNLHQLTFEHPLGKVKPLDKLFNIGPFPVGGSYTSVNNAGYFLDKNDFHVNVGPSMRQIIDLSNINNSLSVITTGQSGHPLSKHYKDQAPLWLSGDYHPSLIDSTTIHNSDFDRLILSPEK
ncbi:MAG: penicillin acylase family protein [bacterium]|nr:penicillin acylase family protein [bacterium]